MLQKSKITKRWYTVESLSESEKIELGFTDEIKKELEEVPKSVKKSHAQNINAGNVIISKPILGEVKKKKSGK